MAAALMRLYKELVRTGYRRTLWPLMAMRLTSAAPRQTVERVHAKVLKCRERHEPLLLVLRSWKNAAKMRPIMDQVSSNRYAKCFIEL